MRYDLAHLMFRMKRFSEAQDIITSAIEISESQSQDLMSMEWEVKLIHLLAQVQLKTDKKEVAIQTLKRTHAAHQK